MARYKLLDGIHVENTQKLDETGKPVPVRDTDGKIVPRQFVMEKKEYKKGQAVESDRDLVQVYGPNKFAVVGARQAPVSGPSGGPIPLRSKPAEAPQPVEEGDDTDLESLTVAELREKAAEEEVDLTGAHSKADIVKAFSK